MLEIYTWARGWPSAHILECGVRTGNSTAAILAALEVDRRGCLWSLDINDPDVPEHWHELDYWQFLKASSVSARAQDWAPDQLEMLFLDSDHEYKHVLRELQAWVPRVVAGGVVLVHDTEWGPGDVRLPAGEQGPVAEALDEYCQQTGLEWRNRPGCYGLGVMRVR